MNMECPNLASVGALIDDELPDAERAATLRHIDACAACRKELENLRDLRSIFDIVQAEPSVKPRVLAALPRRVPAPRFLRARISLPLPVAAAILIVFGLSIFGNAYLGLNQGSETRGGSGSGSVEVRNPQAGASSSSPAIDQAGKEGSRPSAGAHGNSVDARRAPSRESVSLKREGGPMVFKQESEQGTFLFVAGSDYRFSSTPKIYIGGRFEPSKER